MCHFMKPDSSRCPCMPSCSVTNYTAHSIRFPEHSLNRRNFKQLKCLVCSKSLECYFYATLIISAEMVLEHYWISNTILFHLFFLNVLEV